MAWRSTHWCWVTHLCISNYASIGLDNGLLPAPSHYLNQCWNENPRNITAYLHTVWDHSTTFEFKSYTYIRNIRFLYELAFEIGNNDQRLPIHFTLEHTTHNILLSSNRPCGQCIKPECRVFLIKSDLSFSGILWKRLHTEQCLSLITSTGNDY